MKKLPELTPREAQIFDVWTTSITPDIEVLSAQLCLQPASLRRYLRALRTKGYLGESFKSTGRAVVGGRHGIVVDKLITTLDYATPAEVAEVIKAPVPDPVARLLT